MRKKCLYVRKIQYLLILEDKRFTLQMAIAISWAVSETKEKDKGSKATLLYLSASWSWKHWDQHILTFLPW